MSWVSTEYLVKPLTSMEIHKSWNQKGRKMGVQAGDQVTNELYKHMCLLVKSLQSCVTLCDPIDYSLPVSSVHGILQARILEWVSMLSSGGSS